MHWKTARETWEATPMPTVQEANLAQRDMLLENATREDLIAMVTLLDGENKKLKEDLASATLAARINAETIREMQRHGS